MNNKKLVFLIPILCLFACKNRNLMILSDDVNAVVTTAALSTTVAEVNKTVEFIKIEPIRFDLGNKEHKKYLTVASKILKNMSNYVVAYDGRISKKNSLDDEELSGDNIQGQENTVDFGLSFLGMHALVKVNNGRGRAFIAGTIVGIEYKTEKNKRSLLLREDKTAQILAVKGTVLVKKDAVELARNNGAITVKKFKDDCNSMDFFYSKEGVKSYQNAGDLEFGNQIDVNSVKKILQNTEVGVLYNSSLGLQYIFGYKKANYNKADNSGIVVQAKSSNMLMIIKYENFVAIAISKNLPNKKISNPIRFIDKKTSDVYDVDKTLYQEYVLDKMSKKTISSWRDITLLSYKASLYDRKRSDFLKSKSKEDYAFSIRNMKNPTSISGFKHIPYGQYFIGMTAELIPRSVDKSGETEPTQKMFSEKITIVGISLDGSNVAFTVQSEPNVYYWSTFYELWFNLKENNQSEKSKNSFIEHCNNQKFICKIKRGFVLDGVDVVATVGDFNVEDDFKSGAKKSAVIFDVGLGLQMVNGNGFIKTAGSSKQLSVQSDSGVIYNIPFENIYGYTAEGAGSSPRREPSIFDDDAKEYYVDPNFISHS